MLSTRTLVWPAVSGILTAVGLNAARCLIGLTVLFCLQQGCVNHIGAAPVGSWTGTLSKDGACTLKIASDGSATLITSLFYDQPLQYEGRWTTQDGFWDCQLFRAPNVPVRAYAPNGFYMRCWRSGSSLRIQMPFPDFSIKARLERVKGDKE